MELKREIKRLKKELDVTILGHFYQRDDVFECADISGDSLELAKKSLQCGSKNILFCGVGFMGQSVKILDPSRRVFMPKIACCAMAKMIDKDQFEISIKALNDAGIESENIMPITYINSNADIKAEVAKLGGMVCTSSNATIIIQKALESGKKILFIPDRCLGQNLAIKMGKKSAVIGVDEDIASADIICYDGFCSVHQLFTPEDVEFFRDRYEDILVIAHPECDPSVTKLCDFVGSTSQIIKYVKELPLEQKVAVGTEFNLVKRLREKNTYVLSSTKPECPTMNETTLQDLYDVLVALKEGKPYNEIVLDDDTMKWAKIALERMLELS